MQYLCIHDKKIVNDLPTTKRIGLDCAVSLSLGDIFQGGIVGYIFNTGDTLYLSGYIGGIILQQDNPQLFQWGYTGDTIGSTGLTIGTGQDNTTRILNGTTLRPIAASYSDTLSLSGFTDWFLPSFYEIKSIKNYLWAPTGFTTWYWTSSEHGQQTSWIFDISHTVPTVVSMKTTNLYVKPIRFFYIKICT